MKSYRFRLASMGLVGSLVCAAAAARAAESSAKLEDSLTFSRSGGPAQDIIKKCIEDGFTKEFNVRVDSESAQAPQALAKVLAQRNNPTIDVLWTDSPDEYAGAKQKIFVPLDKSLVPNLANVDPKFASNGPGVPVSISIQGIQYNTDVFKQNGWEPPTSWKDLWDSKYKGRVGLFGMGAGSGQAILAVSAYLNGGDPENFDAGFDYLRKIKPNVYTIFDQAPQYNSALLSGAVDIGISGQGQALGLMQQGAPIAFVQPTEGVLISNLLLEVIKGSPHPNAALAFVNWMLSGEAQSCLPGAGYPPVIRDVKISPNLAPYLAVKGNVIPIRWSDFVDKLPELLKRWNEEMAG